MLVILNSMKIILKLQLNNFLKHLNLVQKVLLPLVYINYNLIIIVKLIYQKYLHYE